MEQLVLVVDDDEHICEVVRLTLTNEQFKVVISPNGNDGLEKFRLHNPDLVILDVMLPGQTGWEVCREIRKTSNTPILMLTAKGEEMDRILGLELGADDYVVKPFSPRELVARVRAILRRVLPAVTNPNTLRFADVTIDFQGYEVRVDNTAIALTPKEFELLSCLAQNPGRMFSREQLLSNVWGYDYLGDARTVDEHIKRLRQKVESRSSRQFIKTVWGLGYKFEVNQT
ncbi:MAG TPA: response regulator transcription factor [Verrucomicrobiae bacterium]|nr:response regulator transcription factor [Verrucomicrobiae bacterium]